ncbi:TULIP family P47-like protein [Brevibacillus laterosporus]|uniref:TULIP family P47-like protein n=1 Tax=Brevibacillus laterosporus TaxID=1465 RepID=UPI0035A681FF
MTINRTDTLNWDTVFAIPISKVNETIIKQKSSPKNFQYERKSGSVKGVFGDWQITKGGDGSFIHLSIPINNLTGLYGKHTKKDFSWTGFSLIVEVSLQFLPHDDNGEKSNNSYVQSLKIKTKSIDPTNPVVSLVTTISKDSAGNPTEPKGDAIDDVHTPDIMSGYISDLIVDWLNENLEDFNHVFATVNLNNYIDKDSAWAWCKPTYVDYAYVDKDSEESLLGVLCMTGGRKGSVQQLQQIDPYVIPKGSIAGFLVSEERLLTDLLLPTLPMKWKKSCIQDYEVIYNSDIETGNYRYVLQLKQGNSIELDHVEQDGKSYTPYMKTMKIALEEDQLIFDSYTETDVGMGITAWCRSTHYYTITLGKNRDGHQTLIFQKAKEPNSSHGTLASQDTEIEKWAIIIAGLLATVIVGVCTDGATFVVTAILIGSLTGLAALEPSVIENYNNDTSPDIDLLVFNVTSPIQWNSSGVFNLNYAGIAGPLQLGGTPDF